MFETEPWRVLNVIDEAQRRRHNNIANDIS